MKRNIFYSATIVALTIISGNNVNAQVAINSTGAAPSSSAMLDISSTDKGLLIPRTTPNSITTKTAGLLIYDTGTNTFQYWNGSAWSGFAGAGSGINSITANTPLSVSGTTDITLSLGTVPLTKGGTGATNPGAARASLSAAKSGANSDITSLTGLETALTVSQGGTGAIKHTVGSVLIGNGANSLISANNFFWDSANDFLGIGNSIPTCNLDVTGDVQVSRLGIGKLPEINPLELADGAYSDGTSWVTASDSTLKRSISNLSRYGLNTVLQLNPVQYYYKSDKINKLQIGFIAQELKLIVPEVVVGNEGKMGVSYGNLVPVLTNAIKEQQAIIENQEARIKSLEERLTALEQKISK